MREMLERGGLPVAEELTRRDKALREATNAMLNALGAGPTQGVPADSDERKLYRLLSLTALDAVGFFDLEALARIIGSAYPNDPGTSDLDDEQPVSISLGVVRQAWAALAKVDR
jgi:hypothetical protein